MALVALTDPPRDEIPEVIRTLRQAGIRIHMVTGDFKLTAQAIAANCGIISQPSESVDDVSALDACHNGRSTATSARNSIDDTSNVKTNRSGKSIVLSGSDMMDLDVEQWDSLCGYDEIVFARTTPEQKLRIVEEFQARKNTVASMHCLNLFFFSLFYSKCGILEKRIEAN